MKLYYITCSALPTKKAFGIGITKMCEKFGEKAEVVLVCAKKKSASEDIFSFYRVNKNFTVKYLPVIDFTDNKFVGSYLTFLIKNVSFFISALFLPIKSTDVIYLRDIHNLFLKFKSKNIFLEIHFLSKKDKIFLPIIKMAKGVIVVSKTLKENIISLGYPQKKVIIAEDAVDLSIFDLDISKSEARAKLNLPQDKKLLVYTGRFTTKGMDKGISDIISALKIIGRDKEVMFVAVGGSDEDINHYNKMAEQEGTSDLIILRGNTTQQDLAIYQKAADVLLMPWPENDHYRYYMSPLKMFEYMASRRPIITSDLPTIREVLDEQSAIFCRPSDYQDLASKIIISLENNELSEAVAQKAYEMSAKYTWDNRAGGVLAFINQLSG